MFNLSGSEIVVILLLALVVLGPEKLPEALRRAGKTYSELKKMGNSFQSEMKSVLDEPMKEMRETADLLKKSVDFTDGEFTSPTTSSPPRVTPKPSSTPTATASAMAAAAATPSPAGDTGPEPTPDEATVTAPPADVVEPPPALSPEDELINRTLSGDQ